MDILTYRKHRSRASMLWKSYEPLTQKVYFSLIIALIQSTISGCGAAGATSFQSIGPGPMLSISQNVHMFVCVCVFTFEVLFKRLFAPTSWSRMSNIFRDSESLGKSYAKKWSQIWTFLCGSCLKSPRKNKLVFLLILPYKTCWKPPFPMDLWSKGISLILAYL